MIRPRYPTGEEVHAGDSIVFQEQRARVLFVKQINEFAVGIAAAEWDFISDNTIGLEFEDGRYMGFDGFCHHDGIILLSRSGAEG